MLDQQHVVTVRYIQSILYKKFSKQSVAFNSLSSSVLSLTRQLFCCVVEFKSTISMAKSAAKRTSLKNGMVCEKAIELTSEFKRIISFLITKKKDQNNVNSTLFLDSLYRLRVSDNFVGLLSVYFMFFSCHVFC